MTPKALVRSSLEGPVQLSVKRRGSDYDREAVMERRKEGRFGMVIFLGSESGS